MATLYRSRLYHMMYPAYLTIYNKLTQYILRQFLSIMSFLSNSVKTTQNKAVLTDGDDKAYKTHQHKIKYNLNTKS